MERGGITMTDSWTLKCPKCGSTDIQRDCGNEVIKELDGTQARVHWEFERCRSCGQVVRDERHTILDD